MSVRVFAHTCARVSPCVCLHACVHVCLRVCAHCTGMDHVSPCMCVCTHMCTRVSVCVCTHVHACVCTHVCTCVSMRVHIARGMDRASPCVCVCSTHALSTHVDTSRGCVCVCRRGKDQKPAPGGSPARSLPRIAASAPPRESGRKCGAGASPHVARQIGSAVDGAHQMRLPASIHWKKEETFSFLGTYGSRRAPRRLSRQLPENPVPGQAVRRSEPRQQSVSAGAARGGGAKDFNRHHPSRDGQAPGARSWRQGRGCSEAEAVRTVTSDARW